MNDKHIGWRNCPNCGTEFEITTSTTTKIYCHDKCKRELHKERDKQLRYEKYLENKKSGLDTKIN